MKLFFAFLRVLMPEHIHLMTSEPDKALLSKAIQAIKLSVAVKSLG
jgi:REP element-mobilizing transposase RayT